MSGYGVNLFTNFNKTINPPSNSSNTNIINGFLSIYKFTEETTPSAQDIDSAIFVTKNLVFSPDGSLYFAKILNEKPSGQYNSILSYLNPLTASLRNGNTGYSYGNNYLNWLPIDYAFLSKYNNDYEYPQYFLSIAGKLGNNVSGSGFILYRDSTYSTNTNFSYYLLLNPFNRSQDDSGSILINDQTQVNLLNTYCRTVQYQDPMCYCYDNIGDNRCIYGYVSNQTDGDVVLSKSVSTDPRNITAMQTIHSTCGCNSICKNYGGYNSLAKPPNCANVQNLTLCATGFTTGAGGTINLPNLTLNTACGPPPPPPPPPAESKLTFPIPIIVGLLVVIIFLIVGFLILKK